MQISDGFAVCSNGLGDHSNGFGVRSNGFGARSNSSGAHSNSLGVCLSRSWNPFELLSKPFVFNVKPFERFQKPFERFAKPFIIRLQSGKRQGMFSQSGSHIIILTSDVKIKLCFVFHQPQNNYKLILITIISFRISPGISPDIP